MFTRAAPEQLESVKIEHRSKSLEGELAEPRVGVVVNFYLSI